jgi:hypothetical protein
LRWFSHLSRHCFPRRPFIFDAMKLHFRWPCSPTSFLRTLSSCSVHCCVLPLLLASSSAPAPALALAAAAASAPAFLFLAAAAVAAVFAAFALAAADGAFAFPLPVAPGTKPFRSSLDAACITRGGGGTRERATTRSAIDRSEEKKPSTRV